MAKKLSELNTYNWSPKFKEKELKEAFEKFYNSLNLPKNKHLIDLKSITIDEAIELGFSLWDENMPNFYLFPLWFIPLIPIGTELTSIEWEKIIYDGTNIDNDIRFGCIPYGIELDIVVKLV